MAKADGSKRRAPISCRGSTAEAALYRRPDRVVRPLPLSPIPFRTWLATAFDLSRSFAALYHAGTGIKQSRFFFCVGAFPDG